MSSVAVITALRDGVFFLPLILTVFAQVFGRYVTPFQRIFDPIDTRIAYPHIKNERLGEFDLIVIAVIYPAVVILIWTWRCGFSIRQAIYSLNGLLMTVSWTMLVTDMVKVVAGRHRPDFLDRCKPVEDPNAPGGWSCTGNPSLVNGGRVSFPSGHSSWSFAGCTFLVLFVNGTLLATIRRNAWIRSILIVLLSPALFTVISRLCDYRHHPEDVIAGTLLGIFTSIFWYRTYFVPVKDDIPVRIEPRGAPLLACDTHEVEYSKAAESQAMNGLNCV